MSQTFLGVTGERAVLPGQLVPWFQHGYEVVWTVGLSDAHTSRKREREREKGMMCDVCVREREREKEKERRREGEKERERRRQRIEEETTHRTDHTWHARGSKGKFGRHGRRHGVRKATYRVEDVPHLSAVRGPSATRDD